MKLFEIGKKYSMFSVCDQNCIWSYTVIKRTAKTVTLQDDHGKTKTCRINASYSTFSNAETVFPLGQYSMCPILHAN